MRLRRELGPGSVVAGSGDARGAGHEAMEAARHHFYGRRGSMSGASSGVVVERGLVFIPRRLQMLADHEQKLLR